MSQITSVNLSTMPFVSSCDSTRANMSAKQFSQSLTHRNCDVPYVTSNEWRDLSKNSTLGIHYAEEDGEVIFNKHNLLIEHYPSLGKINVERIDPIQRTSSIFASTLRDSLREGSKFQKGDILYEYDCFRDGLPSSGYNVNTMYSPFFGFNHEDSLVISESFSERAKHNYCETVFIPIYEYTLFQKLYTNHLGYLPEVGEKIQGDVICTSLLPTTVRGKKEFDTRSIKTQVLNTLENLSLSDLINMKVSGWTSGFVTEKIKTKITHGVVSGLKIHQLRKNVKLIDKELQKAIDNLYYRYSLYILDIHSDLSKLINEQFAKKIIRQYFLYGDKDKLRKNVNLSDVVYLLEFEISKEDSSHIGDKMSKSTH